MIDLRSSIYKKIIPKDKNAKEVIDIVKKILDDEKKEIKNVKNSKY